MQPILAFLLLAPSFLLQQLPEAAAIMTQQAAAAQKYRTLQYIGDSSTEMLSGPFAGTRGVSLHIMSLRERMQWRTRSCVTSRAHRNRFN